MRTSVTSESAASPTLFVPALAGLRCAVSGDDDRAAEPVRVRLIDLTRGRRLAAEDEGRRVSDDPLAWVDGGSSGAVDA